jgi:predicted NAD/FAD-binding protein
MGAAIWSTAPSNMLLYPARAILAFYRNHGLLSIDDRPQWRTIVGGSISYLRAFERQFRGTIVTNARIRSIDRTGPRPSINFHDGSSRNFDAVVIATHADQALALLADPDPLEVELLGAWRYNRNEAWLHSDQSLLPPRRGAWASWNYIRESPPTNSSAVRSGYPLPWLSNHADPTAQRAVLTYHMNRLQGLSMPRQYCVTLNPGREPHPQQTIARILYEHPLYDSRSVASRARLPDLNGRRGTYYCGAHFGHGFHEDGARSGAAVAALLGCPIDNNS